MKYRACHDRRYAINCDKIKKEFCWKRQYDFDTAIDITIDWYLNNKEWIEDVKSGEYKKWIELNYSNSI